MTDILSRNTCLYNLHKKQKKISVDHSLSCTSTHEREGGEESTRQIDGKSAQPCPTADEFCRKVRRQILSRKCWLASRHIHGDLP